MNFVFRIDINVDCAWEREVKTERNVKKRYDVVIKNEYRVSIGLQRDDVVSCRRNQIVCVSNFRHLSNALEDTGGKRIGFGLCYHIFAHKREDIRNHNN